MVPEKLAFSFVQQFEFNDGRVCDQNFVHHVPFSMPTKGKITMYPRGVMEDEVLGQYAVHARDLSIDLPTSGGPVGSARCFQDVVEYAMDCPFGGAKFVHGMIACNQSGEPFEHAWIEHGPNIIESKWFKGKLFWSVTPATFFAGRILRVKRYKRTELLKLTAQHENCGPWERWLLVDVDKDHEKLMAQQQMYRLLATGESNGQRSGNDQRRPGAPS